MTLAVIPWPADEYAVPMRVEWAIDDPALKNRSLFSGAVQTAYDPFPRWRVTMQFNNRTNAEQHKRAAVFAELQGQSKRFDIWNHALEAPNGTLRGAPTLAATANQFDEQIQINGADGETLLPGDMLGFGGLLVMVVGAGGTVSGGTATVSIAPRLRAQVTSGTSVQWDRPTAQFILSTSRVEVPFDPQVSSGFSVSFEETW